MSENRLELLQTQKLSPGLQTAIRLLTMDMDTLSAEIRKAVEENPALEYVPPRKSAMDYAMEVRTHFRMGRSDDVFSDIPAPPESEETLLERQLDEAELPPDVRRTAVWMVHLLSPRGYFLQSLKEFSEETGIDPSVCRAALDAVQSLEPAGVGAATVPECLCLQLRARGCEDEICYLLAREYLPEIGKGNLRRIAEKIGEPIRRVTECVEVIRSLSPVPCYMHEDAVQYIMPEFSVLAESGGLLTIRFHNDYYPTIRPDASFAALSRMLEGDELAGVKKMMVNAERMIRAVEMRQRTMEKIADIIVREQRAFFLGQYHLQPLSVEEVARQIDLHASTVYRAVQGKFLDCDRGTFPLNYFFQRDISGGVSRARIQEIIREICTESAAVSDREIMERLKARGISISRRTVAKYRAEMDISSSFTRKSRERP